jgi:hypothetical protein
MMLSFRQSLVNPFLRLMKSGIDINFNDFQLKCTQLLGKKDKLMLNAYAGHDKLSLEQENSNNQQQWGIRLFHWHGTICWEQMLL